MFVYPKYREYQRVADSFDLAELDNIPAISEVFDYAGMRYSKLEGQVRYVVPLSQISPISSMRSWHGRTRDSTSIAVWTSLASLARRCAT